MRRRAGLQTNAGTPIEFRLNTTGKKTSHTLQAIAYSHEGDLLAFGGDDRKCTVVSTQTWQVAGVGPARPGGDVVASGSGRHVQVL